MRKVSSRLKAPESDGLAPLCAICDRVSWGEPTRLGFGKWRHAECYPGSAAWLDYFKHLPADKQTEEGIMLRKFHESTPQNAVERDEE